MQPGHSDATPPLAPSAPTARSAFAANALFARRAALRSHLPFLLVLLVGIYLVTINFNLPWQTMHQDNGLVFEISAINTIRHGLAFTKGQDWWVRGISVIYPPFGVDGYTGTGQFAYLLHGPTQPYLYGDHPPLLGLTIAAAFEIFGYHFWVVRLVPALYALGGLVLFYLLMRYLFDAGIALFASFLYVTFPMFAYFGQNVAHEAPTLFWTLLLLIGYVHWRERPARRWLLLMAASVIIGAYYGWPMVYFATILFALHWLVTRRFELRLALVTALPAMVMFVLVVAQIEWAAGEGLSIARLVALFDKRTDGGVSGQPITLVGWIKQLISLNALGYGRWTQLLLPLSAIYVAWRARLEGWSPHIHLAVLTFCFALCHVLLFRQGAYIHVYWQFYFLPFYALTLGWAGVELVRRLVSVPWLRAAALIAMGIAALALNWHLIYGLYYGVGYHAPHNFVPLLTAFLR